MCDYSLFSIRNRLATEGEVLTVHRFSTGSVGLASPSDLDTAVCVPPGARLLVQEFPERLPSEIGIGQSETVVFFERTTKPYEHRDAVQFNNGQDILLQQLAEGQRVTVLCLAAPEPLKGRQETTADWRAYADSVTT